MSAQPISELELIEHLDFKHMPPCEHSGHDRQPWMHGGPAWALIRREPMCCRPDGRTLYICRRVWDWAACGVVCSGCGMWFEREEVWTLIGLVGEQ